MEAINNKYLECVSLTATPTGIERKKISNSQDAEAICRSFFFDDLVLFESFFLLMLDRYNQTIAFAKISQGGRSGTVVDPAIVAKYAIGNLCSGVILCHNHPSGNTQPSPQDKAITTRIKEGLKLFDIVVLDHIILTENSYFSFGDNGIL